MKIVDAIDDFINYCIFEKGLADRSRTSYRNDLKIYEEFLKNRSIVDVSKIRSEDIKDFLKSGGVPAKFIKKITPEAAERIIARGPKNYEYWTNIYLQENK